jgi:ABC-2 type transport system permease protein
MRHSVFGKTLWDGRRSLPAWALVICALGAMYAAFWPMMRTPEMLAAIEAFPPGLLEALGYMDLATATGYLGATVFGLEVPALVIILAAASGSGITGDEEAGRLDLTLAHPVSRWSVLLQRFAATVVAILVVSLALGFALMVLSEPVELDIAPANLLAAALHLAVLGVFFGALALCLGAATGRRSAAFAVVAVVAVGGFFGNTIGPMVEGFAWLRDISPFHFYSGGEPLENGLQVADLGVLLAASAFLVGVGGLLFDRRDVAV